MLLKSKNIQPEIKAPFKDDLLDREQYAKVLTNILENSEEGFVLSINADWGYGKTTFVKMWEAMLQDKGFQTIYFNAWESDFVADPMMALIDGLRTGFEEKDLSSESMQKLSALWNAAIGVVKAIPQYQVIGQIAEALKNGIDGCLEDKTDLQKYHNFKKIVTDFRSQLTKLSKEISGEKQLIIFVDELDRCRPDYSVQMLERIKHFFAIDNIVFVLSIDKHVICQSISSLYGGDIDAEAYLRRFVDLEFILPSPLVRDFIAAQFRYHHLDEYLDTYESRMMKNSGRKDIANELLYTIVVCFSASDHSLRDVEKYFNRLNIILRSLGIREIEPDVIIYLLYFYMFRSDLYENIMKLQYPIPEFWKKLEKEVLEKCNYIHDMNDDKYRELLYTMVTFFAFYINEWRRHVNYKEAEQILNDLVENKTNSWLPEQCVNYLFSRLNSNNAIDIDYLKKIIELVHVNFARQIIQETIDK